MSRVFRWTVLFLAVATFLPAQRPGDLDVEPSKIVLQRRDKALIVPADEEGQVTVYAQVQPVGDGTTFRYTYIVSYPEGVLGDPPLTIFHVAGNDECNVRGVTTPDRTWGRWTHSAPSASGVTWTTPTKGLEPSKDEIRFGFLSQCAPGTGRVVVGFGPGERHLAAPILTPDRTERPRSYPGRR
jgi:hypothetical protein